MISFDRLSAGYTSSNGGELDLLVVQDFTLDVHEGDVVAFVGASGVGKTTALKAAAGFDVVRSGWCKFDTQDPFPYWYSPQTPSFINFRSALANICVAREFRHKLHRSDVGYAYELTSALGLSEHMRKFPTSLSGGMRRRLALAQSLFSQSPILLLDEPFAELDIHTRRNAEGVFREKQQKDGKTVILVTHDLDSAAAVADRIVIFARDEKFFARDFSMSDFLVGAHSLSAFERRENSNFGRAVGAIQEALIRAMEQSL